MTEYKCPNCNGAIKYNPKKESLECASCGTLFTQEQLDAIYGKPDTDAVAENVKKAETIETIDGMRIYICQSCGAQIAADDSTAATHCPYCGNPVVIGNTTSGLNKPDLILPFKLDKKAAINALVAHYRKFKLVPDSFNPEKHIDDIRGVYVPFWLFDSNASANIVYDATKVRHWSDHTYNYTETSFFEIHRGGSIGFSGIPVDASSKMEDEYMDGLEPFDYNDLKAFHPSFMSGFLADKYDVDQTASFQRAHNRIAQSTVDEFKKTVEGYTTVKPRTTNVNTANSTYRYAMLPVWVMTAKYGDKIYKFAVNGQTGTVAGELPVDKKKLMLLRAGLFLGSAAAMNLIAIVIKLLG